MSKETKTSNLSVALRAGADMDLQTVTIMVAALCIAILPLEISHLLSMFVGAVGYLLLQAIPKTWQRQRPKKAAVGSCAHQSGASYTPAKGQTGPWRRQAGGPCTAAGEGPCQQGSKAFGAAKEAPCSAAALGAAKYAQWAAPAAPPPVHALAPAPAVQPEARVEVWKPSAMPVKAPVFAAAGWEAEVQELLSRISPTADGDAAVANIARTVQRVIRPCLPSAEVMGFASSNPLKGTAFGVAVPEVDIVVSVSPFASQHCWVRRPGHVKPDARKLQKCIIRTCADRLVASGAFKFRRSAFRGEEPKVSLIALTPFKAAEPSSPQAQFAGIPFSLSVNAVTPLHCAALLTECGQINARAKSLILLVCRWAKDRGLSHASRGHLSPYCWTLLTIFYLQVGLEADEGGPLLPALSNFEASAALVAGQAVKAARPWSKPAAAPKLPTCPTTHGTGEKQAGELFVGFIRFYTKCFDWRKEAVSVRLGSRGPPEARLPLHIVLHGDGVTTEVGPSIEDPFKVGCNLGACMNATTMARLWYELARAHDHCSRHASLSELLEPWVPPVEGSSPPAEEPAEEPEEDVVSH